MLNTQVCDPLQEDEQSKEQPLEEKSQVTARTGAHTTFRTYYPYALQKTAYNHAAGYTAKFHLPNKTDSN